MLSIRFAIIFSLSCIAFGNNEQWEEEFDHSTYVDAETTYKMYWTVMEEKVEIGLQIEGMEGWIGWGISPNGLMTNADVIVAWIDDDEDMTVHLSNYYTTSQRGQGPQLMGDQSNVELIDGWREGNFTYFRFYRNIHPCTANGVDIPTGTARVIFAWKDELPEDEGSIAMHASTDCGSKSVNLLLGETSEYELPDEDIDSFELHFKNYTVPDKDTTYFCQLLAFPDKDEIHHMIRIDPIITPGNEGIVHHITMTSCPQQFVREEDIGIMRECDDWRNMPNTNASACKEGGAIFAAWAVGGGDFYFPKHVGYEFGGTSPDALKYAIVEAHYDNPGLVQGHIDSSGFKIYYTPHLREHSAEMISIGTSTHATGVFVPPHMPRVTANGFCTSECTKTGIPEDGVHAFGNLLHLHVLGRALKLRHIRDGKELMPIDKNENYDFDYQQLWLLENEMHIMPGDDLYLECVYDATDRDYMTWGGESTRHEMCLSFLYVYPKTALKMCITAWTQEDYIDFWNTSINNGWATIDDPDDYNTWYYDVSDPAAEQYYRDFWAREQRDIGCLGDGDYSYVERINVPVFEEYPEPDYCNDTINNTMTPADNSTAVPTDISTTVPGNVSTIVPTEEAAASTSDNQFEWDSWYGYTIFGVVGLIAVILLVFVIRMCRKNRSNKNGYRQRLHDEENNMPRPTKRSGSGERGGMVSLQPRDGSGYGATTHQ